MRDKQNSRRGFLKAAVGVAATATVAPALFASSNSKNATFYGYENKKVGSLSKLKGAKEMDFNYPDADSPCKAVLVNGEVKAYSLLCTHKGCPVMYEASSQMFVCPCHFSKFDAVKDGEMIIGQATENIPEILIRVENDNIIAYGVNGLIYGRESNIKG